MVILISILMTMMKITIIMIRGRDQETIVTISENTTEVTTISILVVNIDRNKRVSRYTLEMVRATTTTEAIDILESVRNST
jgi:hypothetical protein